MESKGVRDPADHAFLVPFRAGHLDDPGIIGQDFLFDLREGLLNGFDRRLHKMLLTLHFLGLFGASQRCRIRGTDRFGLKKKRSEDLVHIFIFGLFQGHFRLLSACDRPERDAQNTACGKCVRLPFKPGKAAAYGELLIDLQFVDPQLLRPFDPKFLIHLPYLLP